MPLANRTFVNVVQSCSTVLWQVCKISLFYSVPNIPVRPADDQRLKVPLKPETYTKLIVKSALRILGIKILLVSGLNNRPANKLTLFNLLVVKVSHFTLRNPIRLFFSSTIHTYFRFCLLYTSPSPRD